MKILVTGASGFLGRNFLLRAPRRWRMVAVYHRDSSFPAFLRRHGLDHVVPVKCDLEDPRAVARLFRAHPNPYDACLYLAGNSDIALSEADPGRDARANITPLLHFLQRFRGKRLVFLSSGTVYLGHRGPTRRAGALEPRVPYGISKVAAELYIRHFQQKGNLREYVILRFFGAFGPYERPAKIYTRLLRHMEKLPDRPFVLRGDGKNLIDAIPVSDAVEGILRSLTRGPANVTVDFCGGNPMTINRLVAEAGRAFGQRLAVEHRGSTAEDIRFWASPEPMKRLFGFQPATGLEEGLRELSAWLQDGP